MKKLARILLSFFIVLTFTAIQFPTLAASADLIAGKNKDIGDVLVWREGDNLFVRYVIADPTKWCMTMTHLAVGASLGNIPQTNKGNPIPGRFPYKGIFENGCGAEFTYKIYIAGYQPGTILSIAAHADVRNQEIQENEGAWAAGLDFPGSNWATYFTYTLPSAIIPR